jgi:Zn-dependent protease with chaperone function
MERETLLSLLIVLLGGVALQPFVWWPSARPAQLSPARDERSSWRRLWYPVVPTLLVAAWLCGWALRQPDPVRDPLDGWVLWAAWAPFALIFARAAARAVWALLRNPIDCGVSTVGLIQPQVVFSPFLAKQLEDGVIRAALAHERAHAIHRDPLRIWLAQLITDLQWPWPWAARRLEVWLEALELARDDEARAEGADGADLAAAVLQSVRYLERIAAAPLGMRLTGTQLAHARLIGDPSALRKRVSRLLAPLPQELGATSAGIRPLERAGLLLIPLLFTALVLGAVCGERVMRLLLGMTS